MSIGEIVFLCIFAALVLFYYGLYRDDMAWLEEMDRRDGSPKGFTRHPGPS